MDVSKIRGMDSLLGTAVFPVLAMFRKRGLPSKPKSILLIQLWGVGETILLLPMLKVLRGIFPDARISMLCTSRNQDVFYQNPHVNEVIALDPSARSVLQFISSHRDGYDLAIDCEEYLNIATLIAFFTGKRSLGYATRGRERLLSRSIPYDDQQHCVETFMDLARTFRKIPRVKRLEPLSASPRDIDRVKGLMKRHRLRKGGFIIVAPSVAESSKCRMWPSSRFIALSKSLIGKGERLVFVGGPDDVGQVRSITSALEKGVVDLSGKMSIRELFVFTSQAAMVISNDSGPMHIGAAQGAPTLGLFGPNHPRRFAPFGKGHESLYVQKSCTFSPCINIHEGKIPDCLYPKESEDYQKCMKAITVDEVVRTVEKMLR